MKIQISQEIIQDEFFGLYNDFFIIQNYNLYKNANLTNFEPVFANEGINLFKISQESNYFLVTTDNIQEIEKNYNLVN